MSDFKDAYEAGQVCARAPIPGALAVPVTVTRDAAGAETIVSLERFDRAPSAKRGSVQVFDAASFCDYVGRHQTPATMVFADLNTDRPAIVAVLDGHAPDGPGWHRHRVSLVHRPTPEWTAWLTFAKARHSQVAFAEFVENHIPEIAAPAGAELLEMVQTLEVKRTVEFASAVRLDNGQTQLVYDEQIDGTSRKGAAILPAQFLLALAPFEGTTPYSLTARLRYRNEAGKLVLWIDLLRPERVVEDALRESLTTIQNALTCRVVRGQAPSEIGAL